MAKKKIEDEELESEETESKKVAEKKIDLNFNMDPIERLTIERDNLKADEVSAKHIANFLLKEFEKDKTLAEAYRSHSVRLSKVTEYIYSSAKKMAGNAKQICIEDDTVYGWAIHFIQDGEVKVKPKESAYQISKEDEESIKARALAKYEEEQLEKLRKQEERKAENEKKKIEKAKQKAKENGEEQLSLLDC